MNRKIVLTLVLLSVAVYAFSIPNIRHVANSGHPSQVNVLQVDSESGFLFSGGEDGTVRIWNSDNGQIFKMLQVSHLPVHDIALNPASSHMSAIVSNALGSHYLTVWNWESGEHLYSLPLSEAPLSLGYSPQGSYLIYSNASFKSVHVLQAETGRPLPYLTRGFGIVSAFAVSSSEKNIVTYSPSGTVRYFEIRTGLEIETVRTASEIESISFSPDRRYMAGSSGNSLVYVDLVTGRTVASTPFPRIKQTAVHPQSGEIVVFASADSEDEVEAVFEAYEYESSNLKQKNLFLKKPVENLTALCVGGENVYSADENGTIYSQGRLEFRPSEFSRNRLVSIDDMSLNGSVALSTTESVLILESDYLFSSDRNQSPSNVEILSYPNPLKANTGIAESDESQIYLFRRDGDFGEFSVFNRYGEGRSFNGFPSAIRLMEISGGSALTLDRLGECRITDLLTGTTTFSYTSLGLRTIAYTSDRTIIAGSSRSSRWNSTLLQLDPGTGETVPIDDTNIITFALAFDPVTRQLYSLGIERISGKPRTVLKSHYGKTFDRSRTLISFPGEDLEASLALGNDGTIYTSMGDTGVRSMLWGDIVDFEDDGKLHRELKIRGDWLVALNNDSSLTVWDITTREKILDFYLFEDHKWAAISSVGGYYTSPGAEDRVLFYRGSNPINRDPDKFEDRPPNEPDAFFYNGF